MNQETNKREFLCDQRSSNGHASHQAVFGSESAIELTTCRKDASRRNSLMGQGTFTIAEFLTEKYFECPKASSVTLRLSDSNLVNLLNHLNRIDCSVTAELITKNDADLYTEMPEKSPETQPISNDVIYETINDCDEESLKIRYSYTGRKPELRHEVDLRDHFQILSEAAEHAYSILPFGVRIGIGKSCYHIESEEEIPRGRFPQFGSYLSKHSEFFKSFVQSYTYDEVKKDAQLFNRIRTSELN